MVWRDWLAYLEGYLVLTISGDDPEGFLNLALARGISLEDITRNEDGSIQARMPVREYRALPSLARQSRCRVRIADKRGWPFFSRRLRGRQLLLLGGLFFFLVIYFLAGFIWVVEVRPENGDLRQVTPAQVLAAARAEGLKPGARKSALDIRSLEYALEQRLPQVAWVGISFHGTRAEVAVVEKAAPPQQEPFDRPASIIAARDGVIKDILVINGEARVKAGDTVRQGEILISGLILPPPPPEKQPGEAAEPPRPQPQPRLVRARGIVRARVWYEIEREINRLQVQEMPTGRQQTAIAIQTPKGRYYLKGPARPPYTNCHQKNRVMALPAWRNLSLPVELIITTYAEIQISQRQLTYTEAVDTAGQMALQELKAKLPPGAGVTAQKVIPLSPPDAAIVRVRAWLETEEDIGQAVPLGEAKQLPLR